MSEKIYRFHFFKGLLATFLLSIAYIPNSFSAASDQVQLTAEEKQWLQKHPVIRLGVDPEWPPFDFVDEHGYHQGVAADYLRLVGKRLGISIDLVEGISWSEVLDEAKGKKLDLVSIAAQTPDRSKYLNYTSPVISSTSVIVANDQRTDITGIASLEGKKIGVVKNYSAAELAKKTHSQLTFIEVDSVLDGLQKTVTGEIDAFIDNLGVIGYLISEHSLSSLRIAGDAELGSLKLAFGVRNDWPEFVSILNKGLDSLTSAESNVIRNRWIPIKFSVSSTANDDVFSKSLEWWWLIALILIVVVVSGVLGRVLDRPVTNGEVERLTKGRKFWLAVTFSNLNISAKVLAMLVLVSGSSIVIFGYFDYQAAKDTLRNESFNKLTAVREMKAQQIENYFENLNDLVVTFAQSDTAIGAAKDFQSAFEDIQKNSEFDSLIEDSLKKHYKNEFISLLAPNALDASELHVSEFISPHPATQYLQKTFIVDNPYPTGEKHKYYRLEDGSAYDVSHTKYHPAFRGLLEKFGFYDIFIIDPKDGYILYSVFKEVDYGTSLLTGPYQNSNFATAYRMVMQNPKPGTAILVDFEPYKPSYNAPAAFIAAPIFDRKRLKGVAIFQMPIDRINSIMTSNESWGDVGLGDSGETYIVGEDFRMRNQSRFLIEDSESYYTSIEKSGVPADTIKRIKSFNSTVGLQKVETKGTVAALSGQTSTEIFPDYRNVSVLSAYRPLNIQGMRWALMSEIDAAEAFESAEALKMRMMVLLAILLVSIIGISFVFAKSMTRPIKVLTAKAESLAKGDLGVDINVGGGDEIAHLARSFDMMRNALKGLIEDLEGKVEERTLKLKESEREVRTMVSTIPGAVYRCKPDEKRSIEYISSEVERLTGHYPEDLVNNNDIGLNDLIVQNDREYVLEMTNGSIKRREPYQIECRVKHIDGSIRFVYEKGQAVYDSVGSCEFLIGTIIDITDRKKMEQSVFKSQKVSEAAEKRIRSIVSNLADALIIIDEKGVVEEFSPSAEKMFGYESKEVIGKNIKMLMPSPYKDSHDRYLSDYLKTGEAHVIGNNREIMACRKNGDTFPAELAVSETLIDKRVTYIGLIKDITARKQAEEELAKAKKLAEEANKAKSSFLANMSHELRTPMNAIIGYSEMLAEDAEDDGLDEMIPDLNKINSAGKHLLALINDVLDISKIEAGRTELHLEQFNVPEMISEVISTAQPLFDKNNNQIEIHLDTDIDEIYADLTKVKQVMFNLLSNAAKFTDEGKISINGSIFEKDQTGWIKLAVSDSGIGIPPDKLDHVFDEFSQADSSTTRDYGGTGLGLSLSRNFCRLMGGDIDLDSQVGVGSTFTIKLPLKVVLNEDESEEGVNQDNLSKTDEILSHQKERPILVIDDDPEARDLLKRFLEKDGYHVETSSGGEEGLKLARKVKPRMITLDVMMQDIDGWTVLKQLKEDPELEAIPVVMVSMVSDKEVGYTLGAVDSLSKPVKREELIQITHRYAGDAQSKHVLVVDDEAINRDLINRYLTDENWSVEQAENGKVALEKMQEFKPDLILLDLMMPVMDGFEFAEEIRKHDEYRSIPIIVVSAKSLDDQDKKRLKGSVERIIQKGSIGRQDLLSQIEEILDKTSKN